MLERLQRQKFKAGENNIVVLCTAGKGEDSWTPDVNAVIDMDEQMSKNQHGFLQLYQASGASKTQRRGRGGRYRDTLHLDIESSLTQLKEWSMPYDEELGVVLAAVDLGLGGPIPGIEPGRRSIVEADLVKLAACQHDLQRGLKVTPIGDQVRLLVCKHVKYGYDFGNVLPRDYIPGLVHSIIAACGRERERS